VASERAPAQTDPLAGRGCGTAAWDCLRETNALESAAAQGESPVVEIVNGLSGIPSKTGHVKPCLNPGGPPSKAKYSVMTDSELVPRGKGEKNPC
jgi:hypothetical protein